MMFADRGHQRIGRIGMTRRKPELRRSSLWRRRPGVFRGTIAITSDPTANASVVERASCDV